MPAESHFGNATTTASNNKPPVEQSRDTRSTPNTKTQKIRSINTESKFATMSMTVEEAGVDRPGFPRPTPDTPENVLAQMSMKGKVVAITGASDGIGYAVAEAMAEAGGDVVPLYNSNDAAVSKGEQLARQHGIRARASVDRRHSSWDSTALAHALPDISWR